MRSLWLQQCFQNQIFPSEALQETLLSEGPEVSLLLEVVLPTTVQGGARVHAHGRETFRLLYVSYALPLAWQALPPPQALPIPTRGALTKQLGQ